MKFILDITYTEYGHNASEPLGVFDTVEMGQAAVRDALNFEVRWGQPYLTTHYEASDNGHGIYIKFTIRPFEENAPVTLPEYLRGKLAEGR